MARTIRRKHYVPASVTEEWCFQHTNPDSGETLYNCCRQLEGAERAAQLRWWHEDKSCWWGVRPPKPYRQVFEVSHRVSARNELQRWLKNPGHPVQILRKPKLGYWD